MLCAKNTSSFRLPSFYWAQNSQKLRAAAHPFGEISALPMDKKYRVLGQEWSRLRHMCPTGDQDNYCITLKKPIVQMDMYRNSVFCQTAGIPKHKSRFERRYGQRNHIFIKPGQFLY